MVSNAPRCKAYEMDEICTSSLFGWQGVLCDSGLVKMNAGIVVTPGYWNPTSNWESCCFGLVAKPVRAYLKWLTFPPGVVKSFKFLSKIKHQLLLLNPSRDFPNSTPF